MNQTFVFDNHSYAVAACEQLADDLVDFDFSTQPEIRITVKGQMKLSTFHYMNNVCTNPTVKQKEFYWEDWRTPEAWLSEGFGWLIDERIMII